MREFRSPTPSTADRFGFAVATVGDDLLIGAPGDDTLGEDGGAAYLFSADGHLIRSLSSPHSGVEDQFGFSVAAVGGDIVIGAPFDDNANGEDAGLVYVFLDSGITEELHDPLPGEGNYFGLSVAALGLKVLVGAPFASTGTPHSGAVHLFKRNGDLVRTLRGSVEGALFGASVAALGSDVLVGAPLESSRAANAGAAYLFDGASGRLLETFDGPSPIAGGSFGAAVAEVGAGALIGAPATATDAVVASGETGGAAFLFDRHGTLRQAFQNPPQEAGDRFGLSVGAGGLDVLVGVPRRQGAGAVYRFVPCRRCPEGCGNGIVEEGEGCDDPYDTPGDRCGSDCSRLTTTTTTTSSTSTTSSTTTTTVSTTTTSMTGSTATTTTTTSTTATTSPLILCLTDEECGDGCDGLRCTCVACFFLPTQPCCRGFGGCVRGDKPPDGSPCDDRDTCTTGDRCEDERCLGAPRSCPAGPCQERACDSETGLCLDPSARPDGTPCDDEDVCTDPDRCENGVCRGANPTTCSASDQCHFAGICDPGTGVCSDPLRSDGSPCDDGRRCTSADRCTAGECGGDAIACPALDQCHDPGACDPATGVCSNPNKADGASCNDGDACTESDRCGGGRCAGTARSCDDGNACSTDDCDPLTGCTHSFQPGCQPCTLASQCDDRDPCTTDLCSDGTCANPVVADGSSCSNGNRCDGDETCLRGTCTRGTSLECADGNPCTRDDCDSVTGCSQSALPDGSRCADANVCDGAETCRAGQCTPGAPLGCDDDNPCTTASCDPATGCQNAASSDGVACGDQNVCNGAETCEAGLCRRRAPLACTSRDPCTESRCDPARGCVPEPRTCFEGVRCAFLLGLDVDSCSGEVVPRAVSQPFNQAEGLIEKAEDAGARDLRKSRQRLRSATGRLATASRKLRRHIRAGRISVPCGQALGSKIADAEGRAKHLIEELAACVRTAS